MSLVCRDCGLLSFARCEDLANWSCIWRAWRMICKNLTWCIYSLYVLTHIFFFYDSYSKCIGNASTHLDVLICPLLFPLSSLRSLAMLSGWFRVARWGWIWLTGHAWFFEAFTFRKVYDSNFLHSQSLLFPHFLKIVLALSSIVVHCFMLSKARV